MHNSIIMRKAHIAAERQARERNRRHLFDDNAQKIETQRFFAHLAPWNRVSCRGAPTLFRRVTAPKRQEIVGFAEVAFQTLAGGKRYANEKIHVPLFDSNDVIRVAQQFSAMRQNSLSEDRLIFRLPSFLAFLLVQLDENLAQ